MGSSMDHLAKDIEILARTNAPEALAQASELVKQYPGKAKAWALRAYVFGRNGYWSNAIDDLTRAIEIWPSEPSLFFHRGRYHIKLGEFHHAIDDFDQGLIACDHHSSDYYRETFHFMRAYVRLETGDKTGAADDLANVRDGFALWINSMCSKSELMMRCQDNSVC